MSGPHHPPGEESPGSVKTIGEPNPWHRLCGFYPPDIVASQRDLTEGQERLYEVGVRLVAARVFMYGFDTIAGALGSRSARSSGTWVTPQARLIRHKRRLHHNSNR